MTATLELPPVGEPLLTLKDVSKSYGTKRAAVGVNLAIPRGSIYGFLGPNGAGKTTTIRAIMNIILPDAGEILLAGQPLGAAVREAGYRSAVTTITKRVSRKQNRFEIPRYTLANNETTISRFSAEVSGFPSFCRGIKRVVAFGR